MIATVEKVESSSIIDHQSGFKVVECLNDGFSFFIRILIKINCHLVPLGVTCACEFILSM